MRIIGRKKELETLEECYNSNKSEFVGLFGRRRVGKTFIVKEAFRDRLLLHVTGIYNGSRKEQINKFCLALNRANGKANNASANTWFEAFELLQDFLVTIPKQEGKKKVIFLDELPWMDTPKSNFLSALEYFWNNFAAWEHDIMLIVCGSATSWIVKKIIDNHGGLHNRLTARIHLHPFTLAETEEFILEKGINWSRYDIARCYMIMGGVPYYLDYLRKGSQGLNKNIDSLFFSQDAVLREEYDNLFCSLFKNAKPHVKVIECLSQKNIGLTRAEIIKGSGLDDNGDTSEVLSDLEACGFIRRYKAYGKRSRGSLYQIVDFYTLFYLQHVKGTSLTSTNHWSSIANSPAVASWMGNTFEMLCTMHTHQMQQALGFSAVASDFSAWRATKDDNKRGAQVDLVIDRRDDIINLCEMKFSREQYEITLEQENNLINKIERFKQENKTRKAIHLTLVTVSVLK